MFLLRAGITGHVCQSSHEIGLGVMGTSVLT
jgi:hypothetical protein